MSTTPSWGLETWDTSLLGDSRSVGRGGSGIVLADDLWGIFENPAGGAMLVDHLLLQFSKNSITDTEQYPSGTVLRSSSYGLIVPSKTWTFSYGSFSISQPFSLREYSISSSHSLLHNHLAVGAALNLGSYNGTSFGTTLGAIYRLPRRILLGASGRTAMNYEGTDGTPFSHPWNVGLGIGVIPNRFSRAELGIRFVGPTTPTGSFVDVEPHLGLEYQMIDLSLLRFRVYVGSYLQNSRVHGTAGFGVNLWIFSVGMAIDHAVSYENSVFAFNLDIGSILKKLKVLPTSLSAPSEGILPKPFEVVDDWLPQKIQDDPENSFHEIGASFERTTDRLEHFDRILKDEGGLIRDEKERISGDLKEIRESL